MCFQLKAQVTSPQNFSSIRVDELSDAQIRSFMRQVEASGLTQAQLEQYAASKGMSPTEVKKLRERVDQLNQKDNLTKKGKAGEVEPKKVYKSENPADSLSFTDSVKIKSQAQLALETLKSRIFGMDLFKDAKTAFEPNLKLATPRNYVLGPGDELLIDIYGYSEVSHQLTISPEGTINIPLAGVVQIANLTIEAATARIRTKLTPIYSNLSSGNTKLSVTLGNIRSIKVILTGEVNKPGTYTLPSVATAFNALYASGGPTENGSFREVEIIRAGKQVASLDVYDFLLSGTLQNNIRLQDQDIIRIPTYRIRVEMVGEVKRPAIFEMKTREILSDLLRFAGGFTERAYQARIKVLRNTDTERLIRDVTADKFGTFLPLSGDKYFVNEILDRFQNRVSIRGAVFRPGQYELEPGISLKKLIQKAEGLREDAFPNRAYLTRLGPDLQIRLLAFDPQAILSGTAPDILLQREDKVEIASIFDLKEAYKVEISGDVREPGTFPYAQNMNLEELIIKAGGLKESASVQRVEVSRRVINSDQQSGSATARTAEIFQVDIDKDLKGTASTFTLQPFDIVVVRSAPGYEEQKQVKIEGEVLYPGIYTITRKDERISDLIKRAGGLTQLAYRQGASLKRKPPEVNQASKEQEQKKLLQFKKLQKDILSDTAGVDLENKTIRNAFVGINLTLILENPGQKQDLFLEEGDLYNVPKQLQTVKINGEVLSPVTVVYNRNRDFKYYIASAGGLAERARKKRSYIQYANGSVKSTKNYIFFNHYPKVKPGAEIIVPLGPPKKIFSISEIVGLTTSVLTLLLLFNQLNK